MSEIHDIQGVPRRFGRHVEHDDRSRAYGIVVNPAATLVTRLWDNQAPVLDQGQLGSCTGNAMAQWENTTRTEEGTTHDWLTEEHAVELYARATQLDDIDGTYPPDDTGSSGLAVAKAAQEKGYIRSYRHAFGLQQLLHALQAGPVIVGTVWLAGMNEPGADAVLNVAGDELGGHEYAIIGCDMEREQIVMLNSWSDQWGEHGRARIAFADMDSLLKQQGDVTVPVTG